MDRRGFIKGVGALAASAGAAVGVGSVLEDRGEVAATNAPANVPATTGRASAPPAVRTSKLVVPVSTAVALGHLTRGNADTMSPLNRQSEVRGRLVWQQWAGPTPDYSGGAARHVTIVGLQRAGARSAVANMDILAHFAIDEAPYLVPFYAWSHTGGKVPRSSSPITFSMPTPNRASLEINYQLDRSAIAGNAAATGSMNLPIGTDGLSPGIYVLTTPAARTGVAPDLNEYMFSGDADAPLVRLDGAPLDFDHLVFAVRAQRV
jgi:hypothetical protein